MSTATPITPAGGGGGGVTGLSGDVTAGPGTGVVAATIAANVVTNAKAAQMAANTIKGNNTAGTANATDLTAAQATAMLNVFTGALNGLAPSGGSSTTFLRGDATWVTPTDTGITQLTGDVTAGPGSGSQASTIAANAVTNAKLAQAPANTLKGNNTNATANETDLTATQVAALVGPRMRSAVAVRGLRIFGHSYSDAAQATTGATTISNTNFSWYNILGAALSLQQTAIFNFAINGTRLTTVDVSTGWAYCLNAIRAAKPAIIDWPFVRSGECMVVMHGINDIGNNTAASQAAIRADFGRNLEAIISMHRAATYYAPQTASQWTFGANFSNAASAADFTMGLAKQATVVDSAGTSTATFTIPYGYDGEPIVFYMVALTGGSLVVTWGGTVTGTSSIVGRTDTLSGLTVNAQGAYTVRFTAGANGLSAANAGQTITVRITTVSGSTFYLDGAVIEARKPAPVVVCNVPRLPSKTIAWQFGDAGITNTSGTLTSNIGGQFVSATDVGQALTVTDGGGGLQANTTITAVASLTSATISPTANATRTNAKMQLLRKVLGYGNYSTNTNFSGATVSSHAAADADIDNMNTQIATSVAKFGSMVQVADINAALGNGDATPPNGQLSWFAAAGLHPSEPGQESMANAIYKAMEALAPEDNDDIGVIEAAGSASYHHGNALLPIVSGQLYTSPYSSWAGSSYTAVAGDIFFMPILFTAPTLHPGAFLVEQTNAPATSGSNVRVGYYLDQNLTGQPSTLYHEVTGSAFALGTTAGVKTVATEANREFRTGLYWLAIKVDSLGTTASQLRALQGPCPLMPNWTSAGGAVTPMAWKVTGQAAGALPKQLPSGATLVSTAPALGVVLTVF